MSNFLHLLLYSDAGSGLSNWALLGFRVLLAFELLRAHGLPKLKGADGRPEQVLNPLGLPPLRQSWPDCPWWCFPGCCSPSCFP
ncbi:MAG: hypothetical protein ICV83_29375 [Cytophagales bacterium]|nr:hypothetical protein [Cytophagales bacterium]